MLFFSFNNVQLIISVPVAFFCTASMNLLRCSRGTTVSPSLYRIQLESVVSINVLASGKWRKCVHSLRQGCSHLWPYLLKNPFSVLPNHWPNPAMVIANPIPEPNLSSVPSDVGPCAFDSWIIAPNLSPTGYCSSGHAGHFRHTFFPSCLVEWAPYAHRWIKQYTSAHFAGVFHRKRSRTPANSGPVLSQDLRKKFSS